MSVIINHLYQHTVELRFEPYRHIYSVDGVTIPGVTTIGDIVAKPGLIGWAANEASDYFMSQIEPGKSYDEVQLDSIYRTAKRAHTMKKEDAASVGTITHKWVQNYIEGKDPGTPVNEQVKGATDRFLDWVKEYDVKFLASEQPWEPT